VVRKRGHDWSRIVSTNEGSLYIPEAVQIFCESWRSSTAALTCSKSEFSLTTALPSPSFPTASAAITVLMLQGALEQGKCRLSAHCGRGLSELGNELRPGRARDSAVKLAAFDPGSSRSVRLYCEHTLRLLPICALDNAESAVAPTLWHDGCYPKGIAYV